MPRWPASFVAHGTTANERFGPVEAGRDRTGSRSPSRATMSSATCGVAVAVEATIASRAEPARGVGEPEVVGPEVVAPLRDAVRLVDDEEPDLRLPDPLEEAGRGEALGRDVEQPRAPGRPRGRAPRRFAAASCCALTSATLPGRDALQRLDLVLHQRDERRDDEREVRAHERGQLVAERLARAGGHDDEHVAARERRLHRLRCPGRNARSRTPRAARPRARSPARTAGRLRPEAGQRGRDERIGDEGGGTGDRRP